MDRCEMPHSTYNPLHPDSSLETEHRLDSLRSLVCDLLKTNQELREALLAVRSNVSHNQVG